MLVPVYYSLPQDRAILAKMGLNTNACSKMKDKVCHLNIVRISNIMGEIRRGIEKDDIGAYYELIHGGYIKPYVFLRGIIRVTKNKFPPEKVRRELMANKDKKDVILQRLDLIQYQLAATGAFYQLRTA